MGLPAMLLMLGGCTVFQSEYEDPFVEMAGLRVVPSDDKLPRFEIDLRVMNPNREALKLKGASYKLSLDNFELIKGVASGLPTVPAYGEAVFTVSASLSWIQTVRFITAIANEPRDRVNYEMKAKLDAGSFKPTIRVTESGEIPLTALKSGLSN